jgi:hypothetical protein
MTTKGRAYHERGWRNAKNICQLNARQVEMARALGMSPKKLPVGELIEACYSKRFGGDPLDDHRQKPEPGPSKLLPSLEDVDTAKRVRDAGNQVGNLVCYLMNLADDLQVWLAEGMVAPEVLPQVVQELREIAEDLETGELVWPAPAISLPPRPPRHASSRKAERNLKSEHKIPFQPRVKR